MSITTLTINGVPVENYGLGVTGLDGWLDVATRNYSPVQAPMRPGLIPVSVGSTIDARTIGLKFYVQPTSLLDRRAKLSALFQQLAGQLEISTVEDPSKVCYGFLTDAKASINVPVLTIPQIESDLTVTCFDPLWYDAAPLLYGSPTAGTRVTLPIGSAPIRRLRITLSGAGGAIANPVVILRRQNGAEIQRMTLTVSIATTDYLTIDCDAYTVQKVSSAVLTNVLTAVAPTESFFVIDEPGPSVTLETNLGTLHVLYWRSYWS